MNENDLYCYHKKATVLLVNRPIIKCLKMGDDDHQPMENHIRQKQKYPYQKK